ncbi:MAG: TIGR03809 family protein [Xanthobacteraceae bacterium]
MTKVLTAEVQQKHAERQLFTARRALSHLVQLYESGQWRHLYKEESFAEAVRQARQAVDTWTDAMAEAEAKAKANAI